MAKNFQMQKKNEDGTLEIVHPETNSSVVKHGDKNVDEVLDAKLPYIQSVEITYGTHISSLTTTLNRSGYFYGVVEFSGLFEGKYLCDLNVTGGISYITDTKTGAIYSNLTANNNDMMITTLLTDQYIVNKVKSVKFIDAKLYTSGDGSLQAKAKWLITNGYITANKDEFIFDSYYWKISLIYSSNVQINIKSLASDNWYIFYNTTNNTDLININNINNISLTTKQKNLMINPTLDGTESELTAIQYDGVNYKVPNGYLPITGGSIEDDNEPYMLTVQPADGEFGVVNNSEQTSTYYGDGYILQSVERDSYTYYFPKEIGTFVVIDEDGIASAIKGLYGLQEITFGENDDIIIDTAGISLSGNTNGIKIDGSNVVTENKLKTINGQSILGSGNISIKPPIFEQFDGGTFVYQDSVFLDTSGYNDIIIILEEVAGVDQPATNILVTNEISLRPIPLSYSLGTPFIVRLERLNSTDFLVTATGGCVPTTGIVTDSGDGIEIWFENGTQSEEYAYSFYGK